MEGNEISLVDSHSGKKYIVNTENFDMYSKIMASYKLGAAQMDLMPIWTLREPEYETFQVMSRQWPVVGALDDIKENSEMTKCHLCDVDIPSCYVESHESSVKHTLYKDIADVALERIQRHMSMARPCLRTSSDNTYFCQYCCVSVVKANRTVHESTKEHRESIDRDKAAEKFLIQYKGKLVTDFHDRNEKDDKVPAKNGRGHTKFKNSDAIVDPLNVEGSVVKFEEINAIHRQERNNESINEDAATRTKEIKSFKRNVDGNDDLPLDKASIKTNLEINNSDISDVNVEGSAVKIDEIKTGYYHKTDDQNKIDSNKSTKEIELTDCNRGVTFEDTVQTIVGKESFKDTSNDKAKLTVPKKQVDDVKIQDEKQKLSNETIHNFDGESSNMNSEHGGLEEISARDSDLKIYITVLNDISVNKLEYISEDIIVIHPCDGSKVKVKVNNFHGYVDRDGCVYCTLCDKQVNDVKVHRYDTKHMAKITALVDDENCIRQVESTEYHCVLCNQLLADKDEHLSLVDHKNLLSEEISDTVIDNDERETIYQTDNGKSICVKCTEYVELENIGKHLNTDTHKYNVDKMPIDLTKIIVDDYCNVCEKGVYDKKHRHSVQHRIGIVKLRFSNGDILHYHLRDSTVPYKTCCKICDAEIDKTKTSVESHFSSESHISAYDSLLVENEVQQINDVSFYFECKVCKKRFHMIDLNNHIKSRGHKSLLSKAGKTITMKQNAPDRSKNKIPCSVLVPYELIDCPTKVRCKVCNIQVSYYVNDMRSHKKETIHKANFASMVKKNALEKIGKKYYCQCCDVIIARNRPSLIEHCFRHDHVTKFLTMGPPLDRLSLLIKARDKFAKEPKIILKLRKEIEVLMSESLESIDTKEKDDTDSLSPDKLDRLSFYTAIEESKNDETDFLFENDCDEENSSAVDELEIDCSNKSITQSSDSISSDSKASEDEDAMIRDTSVLLINEPSVAQDKDKISGDKMGKRDQLQDQDQCEPTEIVAYCFLVNESKSIINDECFEAFVHRAVNSENAEIYICKICGTEIDNNQSKIIEHMEGIKHNQKYRSLLLLNKMREYNDNNIFCDICKELCNKIDLFNHLVKEEHTFNLEDSVKNKYEKYIEYFQNLDVPDQIVIALAHKKFLMQCHGTELNCKLCNVDVKDESGDVKKHILTENHFKAYENVLSENGVTTRNKYKSSFCEICKKDLFDLWELQHIYSKQHLEGKTPNSNNECNIAENSLNAEKRKRVRNRNKINVIEKSANDNTLALRSKVADKFYPGLEAEINEADVVNDIKTVENKCHKTITHCPQSPAPATSTTLDDKHDSTFKISSKPLLSNNQSDKKKSTLVSMVIKKVDKVKMFTCVVCNKPIPNDPMTILNHNNSKIHSDNVRKYVENLSQNRKSLEDTYESKKSVDKDLNTTNMDVIVNGFCTVCLKQLPHNTKNKAIHLNGKPHRDNIKLKWQTEKNNVVATVGHDKSLHNVVSVVGVSNPKVTDENKVQNVSECVQNKSHKVTNDVSTTESKDKHTTRNVTTVTNTVAYTNTTETITRNGFCTICQKDVPNNPQNIKEHVKGLSHQTKLKSKVQNNVPKNTVLPSNVLNSERIGADAAANVIKQTKDDTEATLVIKRGMCTVCNKKVSNNPQNIKEHIGGMQHRYLSLVSNSKTETASEIPVPPSNKLNTRTNHDVKSKASESVLKTDPTVSTHKISTNSKKPVVLPNESRTSTNLDVTLKSSEQVVKLDPTINYNDVQNGYCIICDRKVPNNSGNIELHIKGTLHQKNLKTLLERKTQDKHNENAVSKTVESKLSAMDKVTERESDKTNESVANINQLEVNIQQIDDVCYDKQRNIQNESNNTNTESDNPTVNSSVMTVCDVKETMTTTNAKISSVVVLENKLKDSVNSTVHVTEPKTSHEESHDISCENHSLNVCGQTDESSKNTEDINADYEANTVIEVITGDDKDSLANSCNSETVTVFSQTDNKPEETEDITNNENHSLKLYGQIDEASKNKELIIISDVKSSNVFEDKSGDDKDSLGNSCCSDTITVFLETDETSENAEGITNTDVNVFNHEKEGNNNALSNPCESTSLKVTAQTDDILQDTKNVKDNGVEETNKEIESLDDGFFLCRICDITIANNPVDRREHLNSYRHNSNIKEMRNENLEIEKCYEKYCCDICDIKMDRMSLIMSQHNESSAHLKMFNLTLKSNQIQTKNDVCYCEPCDLYFTKYSVPTHVKRQSHKQNLLDVEIEI